MCSVPKTFGVFVVGTNARCFAASSRLQHSRDIAVHGTKTLGLLRAMHCAHIPEFPKTLQGDPSTRPNTCPPLAFTPTVLISAFSLTELTRVSLHPHLRVCCYHCIDGPSSPRDRHPFARPGSCTFLLRKNLRRPRVNSSWLLSSVH